MRYLTIDQVIYLHDRVLTEHGGAPGIRSQHSLEYAVSAPQQSAFGEDAYPTLAAQAAALLFFITMNHPFVDGNKRTGLAGNAMEPEVFFAWVADHIGPVLTDEDRT